MFISNFFFRRIGMGIQMSDKDRTTSLQVEKKIIGQGVETNGMVSLALPRPPQPQKPVTPSGSKRRNNGD